MKLIGSLILRIIIYYIVAVIFYIVVLDNLLGNFLGNTLYKFNYNLYEWCVYNKEPIFFFYMIIILVIALYRFFSKKVDNIEKLYKSFDNILNEETQNIELPNEMTRFSEKLNKIKYEYILSTKRAKEAEQKKNDLIMYMAHDLKTPLTSVIGYLSLLNEEQEISKKLQNKYIKIALDKALRVEELTNQFFEITRYNLNDIPLNKTNIDLVMLLDQLVEEFYPMLEERNLKLNITKPNILMYNADGDKLARAFGNLLKNAISYSYENTTITINMIENEENIEITFKNKGATIPEYKLERIFDKFYRADESRQTNNGGAGLGLAITKEIIELHNGKICAKSNDEFIEFHGDRCFKDDGAIVGGIAMFHGMPVTVIGQQKGKNTKDNIRRNFGMPSPDGYRKALRLMKQAETFGRPIICFVDTPGAFCGLEAEERGQGEAIAKNLFEMSSLKVPVLSIVIGEGGSGGALAMAVANEVWMMENAIYSILSPEGFASILYKDSKKAPEAARVMKVTAADLKELGLIERIIPEEEPANTDTLYRIAGYMDRSIIGFFEKYLKLSGEELAEHRYERFRRM